MFAVSADETVKYMGQREDLLRQKEQIETMLARLDYKIEKYEQAVRTGILSWDNDWQNA